MSSHQRKGTKKKKKNSGNPNTRFGNRFQPLPGKCIYSLSPPPPYDSYHYLLLAIRYKTRRVDCTDGDEHLPFTPLPLPSVALPQKGMGIARRHHFRDRRSTLGAGIYWHGNNGPNPSVIKICARAKLFPVCFFFFRFCCAEKTSAPKPCSARIGYRFRGKRTNFRTQAEVPLSLQFLIQRLSSREGTVRTVMTRAWAEQTLPFYTFLTFVSPFWQRANDGPFCLVREMENIFIRAG